MLFPIKIPAGADALLTQAESHQQVSPVVQAFANLAGTSPKHVISISLGALFVGVILSVWLCGFSVVQTYYYFSFSSINDKRSLKIFVLFVFLIDLCDSILSVSWLWSYLIGNYGDLEYALKASGPFSLTPLLEGIIFVCCTGFFLRRIWALTGSIFLSLVIAVFALVSFGANLATVVFIDRARSSLDSFGNVRVSASVWLVFSILSDAMVSATLVWILQRARTGFAATDAILTKLTRAMLHTGLLTTLVTLCAMTIFLSNSTPLGLAFVPFLLVLPKLRFNSLMATLNGRHLRSSSSNSRKTGTEATLLPTMMSSSNMMASRQSLSRFSLASRASERVSGYFSPIHINMGRSNSRASENHEISSSPRLSLPPRTSSRASQRSRTSQQTKPAQGFDLVTYANPVTFSSNPPSSRKNFNIARRTKRSHSDPQAPTTSILKAQERDLSEDIQILGSAAILGRYGEEEDTRSESRMGSSAISLSNGNSSPSNAAQQKRLPVLSIRDQQILDDPRFASSADSILGAGATFGASLSSPKSNAPYLFASSSRIYSNSPSSSSTNLLPSSPKEESGASNMGMMERDSRFRISTSNSTRSSSRASGKGSLRERAIHPEVFSIHSSRSRS